jgi:hypothetical protein
MPVFSGEPVVTNSCAFYFAHEAAGASAPGIPCALLEGDIWQGSGSSCRENVVLCLEGNLGKGGACARGRW